MTARFGLALGLIMLLGVVAMPETNAQTRSKDADVQQSRGFGYFVGDLLTQRIAIDPKIKNLEDIALPLEDRVGLWVERRSSRLETDEDANRWLVIEYQIINSPRNSITIEIPALAVQTGVGDPIQVPLWIVSIGPLTAEPLTGVGNLKSMQPDRQAIPEVTRQLRAMLTNAVLALFAVLLAWVGWFVWRNWLDRLTLPFERAWTDIKTLSEPNAHPRAWQRLHLAINETADRVIRTDSVNDFLAQAPDYQPELERFNEFFQRSNDRFFAKSSSTNEFDLRRFCLALRRIEKRAAR